MSRIGKRPIEVPKDVEISINGNMIIAKGLRGSLKYNISDLFKIIKNTTTVAIEPLNKNLLDKKVKSLWGLSRTMVNNIISGVSNGFTKTLDFTGVGYKAQIVNKKLILNLGYSHPIEYDFPQEVDISVKANKIEISGCSKELVGFVSAKIRNYRPPEPYKGKGLRYSNEKIIRKAGKTGGKQQS
ncbi:MAG: 50S ribosomal protein L6 [Oligoflexia bacterium]|nr:50S ribosomal protein L6 [Oligoflexia bacterium]